VSRTLLVLLLAFSGSAIGGEAAPAAPDPALEQRVMDLAGELRCLVCQNQTLADSNADLAVDLRGQIREQLKAGATERQVVDFLVARYGDFVLYRPPFKATTVALWTGPFVLLADLVAQVLGERGVGVGEGLVLAHQAAQLVRERRHALLQGRIFLSHHPERQSDEKDERENPSHASTAPRSEGAPSSG
jgi:cytochrome c-type biogenesis protein CcmH